MLIFLIVIDTKDTALLETWTSAFPSLTTEESLRNSFLSNFGLTLLSKYVSFFLLHVNTLSLINLSYAITEMRSLSCRYLSYRPVKYPIRIKILTTCDP